MSQIKKRVKKESTDSEYEIPKNESLSDRSLRKHYKRMRRSSRKKDEQEKRSYANIYGPHEAVLTTTSKPKPKKCLSKEAVATRKSKPKPSKCLSKEAVATRKSKPKPSKCLSKKAVQDKQHLDGSHRLVSLHIRRPPLQGSPSTFRKSSDGQDSPGEIDTVDIASPTREPRDADGNELIESKITDAKGTRPIRNPKLAIPNDPEQEQTGESSKSRVSFDLGQKSDSSTENKGIGKYYGNLEDSLAKIAAAAQNKMPINEIENPMDSTETLVQFLLSSDEISSDGKGSSRFKIKSKKSRKSTLKVKPTGAKVLKKARASLKSKAADDNKRNSAFKITQTDKGDLKILVLRKHLLEKDSGIVIWFDETFEHDVPPKDEIEPKKTVKAKASVKGKIRKTLSDLSTRPRWSY